MLTKYEKLIKHVCGKISLFLCGFRISSGDHLGLCWELAQTIQQPRGITVYNFNVCLHTIVWEREKRKRERNTHLLFTALHLFRQLKSSPVWRPSLTRCRVLWQPPVTVVRGELNLRPLSVSSRHGAPCGVKNAFALFLHVWRPMKVLVVVESITIFESIYIYLQVWVPLNVWENVTPSLAKLFRAPKPLKCSGWVVDWNMYYRNNWWFKGQFHSKTTVWDFEMTFKYLKKRIRILHLENKNYTGQKA